MGSRPFGMRGRAPAIRRRSTATGRSAAALRYASPATATVVPETSTFGKLPAISPPVPVLVFGAPTNRPDASQSDAVEITVLGEESFFDHTLRRRAVGRFIGCVAREPDWSREEPVRKPHLGYHHETVKKESLISYGYGSSRSA
jgi:hypothetical protein